MSGAVSCVSLRQKLITEAAVTPRSSSLRRPRPERRSQQRAADAPPAPLLRPSQPATAAVRQVPSTCSFHIQHGRFHSSSSPSPEVSCDPPDSSSQLETAAPHLSSSRTGSQPPPSSPPSALPAPTPVASSLSQDASLPLESEEEKAKKLLYCSLCKVAVNSLSQLEAHNAGRAAPGARRPSAPPHA